MNTFDSWDLAEALLPRRVVKKLATVVCVVLLVAFWTAPERTTAWLVRQGEQQVRDKVDPFIANLTKRFVTLPPTTTLPRAAGQTSGR